jgi:hypothetical protein
MVTIETNVYDEVFESVEKESELVRIAELIRSSKGCCSNGELKELACSQCPIEHFNLGYGEKYKCYTGNWEGVESWRAVRAAEWLMTAESCKLINNEAV